MNFKRYNLILVYPLLGLFTLIYILAALLEPLKGDLTRLGSYKESEYGWIEPQETFPENLYADDPGGEYKEYHDIVVMGDSFSSMSFPYQWQNYLVNQTGLKVVTFNNTQVVMEEFINGEIFKKFPPKIFVWQFAERFIPGMDSVDLSQCDPGSDPPIKALPIRQIGKSVQPYHREPPGGFLNPNFNESTFYIKYVLKRYFDESIAIHFGHLPRIVRLPLGRDGLFSSRVSNEILLYRGDIQKVRRFKEPMIQNWQCTAIQMQNRIQKNGKTFFVAMPVPDKTTAYEDYIQFEEDKNINLIELISDQQGINMFRLDTVLKEAIRSGEKDIYLPNDTHWGYKGHRLAAETLIDYLEGKGVLKRTR